MYARSLLDSKTSPDYVTLMLGIQIYTSSGSQIDSDYLAVGSGSRTDSDNLVVMTYMTASIVNHAPCLELVMNSWKK